MDISDTNVSACRLKLKADGNRMHRLSSFSTPEGAKTPPPPPPLPEDCLHEFQSPSYHPPPPFSRTCTTLPKPIRRNSNLVLQSPPLTPISLVDCPLPSTQVSRQQPHGKHLLQESPNPSQFSHSTTEISQKARDKAKSAVAWSKLP